MARKPMLHLVNDEKISIKDASEKYDISLETIKGRVRRGMSLQEAIDSGITKLKSSGSNKGNTEWQKLGK